MAKNYVEIPYSYLVRRADPNFESDRHKELEYEFSNGRKFYRDPALFGPYRVVYDYSTDYADADYNTRATVETIP